MKQLQQVVERDQWAELLTDAQNLLKQSRNSEIEVLAFNDKEAIKKASEIFNVPAMYLHHTQTRKGSSSLLGFIKQPAHYIFSVKESFLENFTTTINYDDYNELAKNKDGSFRLQMREKGLCLQVYEPVGLGRSVIPDDIITELNSRGFHSVDTNLIKQAIHKPKNTIILAPYEYTLEKVDSQFYVSIEKDNMSARFTFTAPKNNGRFPELDEIINALLKNGVAHGVNEQYIQEALDNELFNLPIIVAEGTLATNGANAYIEYTFVTGEDTLKHAIRQDGSIDFKELNIIHNVFQDSVLATMHPASRGIVGTTVTGETIPATDGNPAEWSIGSNVHLSPDKSQAIATSSGQVYLKRKQICVDPALEIASDVDLTVGNIDFLGNVIIKGNVTDGFSVISGGNIEVYGHIGKCFMHAEGNIIAHQGIQGKDESQIECNGDFYAYFIERAQVNVGGNLIITKALLHSNVVCDKGVYVTGDSKKSIIAGGSVKANTEIVATQLGAESYIETLMEVGFSKKLLGEMVAITKVIATQEQQILEVRDQVTLIPNPLDVRAIKLEQKLYALTNQKEKNEAKLSSSTRSLHLLQKTATISATKSFMPGVKVKIGATALDIAMAHSTGSLKKVEEHIVLGSFDPSEFTKELIKQNEQSTTKKG